MTGIVSVYPDRYNYFAELETAGKCLEWVKDHLELDEIHIYMKDNKFASSMEAMYRSLYAYMLEQISDVPAGSHGILFTPWLHGNRCPFEDANARGMFFNIGLDNGKRDMIHAVLEGICFHLRWMMETSARKIAVSDSIRFAGGGALAPLTCQILSDVLGKKVETIENPQNAGAMGAAMLAAVGLGRYKNLEDAGENILVTARYIPDVSRHNIYNRQFRVFKALYRHNKRAFQQLNGKK